MAISCSLQIPDSICNNLVRRAWSRAVLVSPARRSHFPTVKSAVETKETKVLDAERSLANETAVFPPSPPTLPVIGNLHQVQLLPTNKFSENVNQIFLELGDDVNVLSLKLLGVTTYVLRHPDEISFVNSAAGMKLFGKRAGARVGDWLGSALLVNIDATVWPQVKATMSKGLTQVAVQDSLPMLASVGCRLAAILADLDGRAVDIEDLCKRAALDVLGKAGMNYEFESLEVGKARALGLPEKPKDGVDIIDTTRNMMGPLYLLALNPPVPNWVIPRYKQYREGCSLVREQAAKILRERREAGVREEDSDLLASMLSEQVAGSSVWTDQQIIDECVGLMFAGQDTTAITLSFLFYSLAHRPAWQQEVAEEVQGVMGDKTAAAITPDDLRRMPKLAASLSETLRLYPAVAGFRRQALEDCTLGKYNILKGTRIIESIFCMHRNPALWPRASEWLPERWMPEGQAELGPRSPEAFQPFGSGPRACPGRNLALVESQVVAAEVLRKVAVEAVPGFMVDLVEPLALSSSTGICIRLRRR